MMKVELSVSLYSFRSFSQISVFDIDSLRAETISEMSEFLLHK